MSIKGKFTVNLEPLKAATQGLEGITLGRMAINKTFFGDLDAESKGEMLTAMTQVEGSAGYVAIEQVNGKLEGKSGTFVLQHYGIMDQGSEHLLLDVVPGSATGELAGLSGSMQIIREGDQHIYVFDYRLESTGKG